MWKLLVRDIIQGHGCADSCLRVGSRVSSLRASQGPGALRLRVFDSWFPGLDAR